MEVTANVLSISRGSSNSKEKIRVSPAAPAGRLRTERRAEFLDEADLPREMERVAIADSFHRGPIPFVIRRHSAGRVPRSLNRLQAGDTIHQADISHILQLRPSPTPENILLRYPGLALWVVAESQGH
jgi:hypothetical protein